jgi:ligand-binding sensor domain-containing protein/anti-sigma regulatory factor (Ser/Thr protein kinase)
VKLLLITLLLSIGTFCPYFFLNIFGQEPSYIQYNIENGAPSNEIYTLLQDYKGYIWIGSDAGIYRFNGINYEYFYSSDLRARSATGLIQSQSGKIYGYNFAGQIFYIDQDTLHVLKSWKGPVNGLATDNNGKVWISSQKGSYYIDDNTLHLTRHTSDLIKYDNKTGDAFTSCIRRDSIGNIYYQNAASIIERDQTGNEISTNIHQSFEVSPILISSSKNDPWLFSLTELLVFRKLNGKWIKYTDQRLLDLLKGRKPNTVTEIDGHLWINTHTGVIQFNLETGDSELFYPSIAFSVCMKDTEGNYWFSTLHYGLLKMPSIEIRSWNRHSNQNTTEQLSHVVISEAGIFGAGTGGEILELSSKKKTIGVHKDGPQADIGMLHFDPIDKAIYYNKLSSVYALKNGQSTLVNNFSRAVKDMHHSEDGYFLLSSQGIYFTKKITADLLLENLIADGWYREICPSPFGKGFFVAGNDGLLKLEYLQETWRFTKKLLPNKQVLSVSADNRNKTIYFLTFDGEIHRINPSGKRELFLSNLNTYRPVQLRIFNDKIYLATIKGVVQIDIHTSKTVLLNTNNGLPSNNIRHLALAKDTLWAASGRGLICIPLTSFVKEHQPGKIMDRGVKIDSIPYPTYQLPTLHHNELLTLFMDGISYTSSGQFQLAYRIMGNNEEWILVPGELGKIQIPRLPSGELTIEVKMIDHQGLDSTNTLIYKVKVLPPLWQRWWFYLLIFLSVTGTAYLFFLVRIRKLRKKQRQVLKQVQLENELRLTQQNALKAQMSPHFLFNVLNSIKGYIYENDKKNAARYLSDFSSLVRKVLEFSSLPTVTLKQEIEALRLYIDLEAMLLQTDFECSISIDKNLEPSCIHVPALLLQPYVENAFKHGLRHKKGEKKLKIHARITDESVLEISISDNGIGRAAAAAINDQERKEHDSFASNAMEKRLELLNFGKKGVVGVEIFDKFDAEGRSAGTTVTIRIHV